MESTDIQHGKYEKFRWKSKENKAQRKTLRAIKHIDRSSDIKNNQWEGYNGKSRAMLFHASCEHPYPYQIPPNMDLPLI